MSHELLATCVFVIVQTQDTLLRLVPSASQHPTDDALSLLQTQPSFSVLSPLVAVSLVTFALARSPPSQQA